MPFKSKDPIRFDAHKQIVRNLRAKNTELEAHLDEVVFNAWEQWSMSDDYPDEKKIVEWIGFDDDIK